MNTVSLDRERLQIISSRLGRQKKLLTSREYGSNRYTALEQSIKRSESLRHKIIIDYLKQIAIITVDNDLTISLPSLVANRVIHNTPDTRNILKNYWPSYQELIRKYKKKLRKSL